MPNRLIAALLPCLILASPAWADDKPAAPKPPKPKKICRTLDVTGSMIAQSVCHTADEWKQIDEQNQRDVDNTMSRPGASRATER